jgi:hypothetical protein
MSIILNIAPELEKHLLAITAKKGIDIDKYINLLIEDKLKEMQQIESELLQKINLGIEENTWEKYYELIEKRENLTLSETEQTELIRISDQIEEANAERLTHLIELANLRNVDLDDLMETLGLKVPKKVFKILEKF